MSTAPESPSRRAKDNERPLVEDIRLLGRILGDVIREQEGDEAFELVERIRKLSVAFRRDADHEADNALKSLLKSLSGKQTVSVIRAFTYFSHLANLAEDRHHIRRRAIHERAGETQEGSIEVALARLRWAGIAAKTVSQTLAQSYLSPVLTAHPTEVQRKSILDAERDIAHLLAGRDEIKARALPKDALAPRELAANEAQIRARVLQLWQTRLLRFTKLTVADEIENALSYYEATFLREIPKIYADLERELGQHPVASFLRMGQWIGGDRDGNPNVSAQTLEYALRRQCEVALRHYLTEVHYLGGELSLSAMLVGVTPPMQALADSSPDAQRAPTGRALSPRPGGHVLPAGRHAEGIHRRRRRAPCHSAAKPLPAGRGIPRRPAHHRELAAGPPWLGAGSAAPAPADSRRGSVRLSPRDGGPAAKLGPARSRDRPSCWRWRGSSPTTRSCQESARRALLLKLLSDARPLRVIGGRYSEHAQAEIAIFETAKRMRERFGAQAIRHYIISHTETVSDLLEVLLLQKEVGLLHGTLDDKAAGRPDRRAPVRNHRRPAQRGAHHARVLCAARHRETGAALGRRAGHHAGLQRQQQGRRHLHQQLGAVPRRDCAGGPVRPAGQLAQHPAAHVPWPRRHRGPRRRPQLPGHPGAAARHRARADPAHRAGRGDRLEIRQPRDRPAQPGNAGRGHAGGDPAAADQDSAQGILGGRRRLSQASMSAYRALVYETPGFTEYFFGSTPIREIAELNIGSRPASRKASQRIEDLRAIPWSFSWGQCRLTLPGWYGFGTAVQEFLTNNPDQDRREGLALLQKMYRQWPFFRALLSNMDMVLAKSDLALASRYAELVTDARLRKRIFATIEAEWHRTVEALQLVTGEKQRLATNPALQRSIRHRFPYIDPLHHLQVELVRRYREGKVDDRARRGIHISINGIAAGLRNTG